MDLLPAAPPPPVQKRDAQHVFLQHRGAQAKCISLAGLDSMMTYRPLHTDVRASDYRAQFGRSLPKRSGISGLCDSALAVGAYASWLLSPNRIMRNHADSCEIMADHANHAPDSA